VDRWWLAGGPTEGIGYGERVAIRVHDGDDCPAIASRCWDTCGNLFPEGVGYLRDSALGIANEGHVPFGVMVSVLDGHSAREEREIRLQSNAVSGGR
jgi:hypothetical protein